MPACPPEGPTSCALLRLTLQSRCRRHFGHRRGTQRPGPLPWPSAPTRDFHSVGRGQLDAVEHMGGPDKELPHDDRRRAGGDPDGLVGAHARWLTHATHSSPANDYRLAQGCWREGHRALARSRRHLLPIGPGTAALDQVFHKGRMAPYRPLVRRPRTTSSRVDDAGRTASPSRAPLQGVLPGGQLDYPGSARSTGVYDGTWVSMAEGIGPTAQ